MTNRLRRSISLPKWCWMTKDQRKFRGCRLGCRLLRRWLQVHRPNSANTGARYYWKPVTAKRKSMNWSARVLAPSDLDMGYGSYFEELETGRHFRHWPGRTLNEQIG